MTNGDLVRRYLEANARNDLDALESMRAPDWEHRWPATGEVVRQIPGISGFHAAMGFANGVTNAVRAGVLDDFTRVQLLQHGRGDAQRAGHGELAPAPERDRVDGGNRGHPVLPEVAEQRVGKSA